MASTEEKPVESIQFQGEQPELEPSGPTPTSSTGETKRARDEGDCVCILLLVTSLNRWMGGNVRFSSSTRDSLTHKHTPQRKCAHLLTTAAVNCFALAVFLGGLSFQTSEGERSRCMLCGELFPALETSLCRFGHRAL